MRNDPHNKHHAKAKKIRDKYRYIINKYRWQSLLGNNEASIRVIQEMTKYNIALKEIGYRTTSEEEPGKAGRIVAITPEWRAAELAKETETDRLIEKARDGDFSAIREIVQKLASGEI